MDTDEKIRTETPDRASSLMAPAGFQRRADPTAGGLSRAARDRSLDGTLWGGLHWPELWSDGRVPTRALVVYCHPVPESFCASIRDAAMEVLRGRGWDVRLTDLYAERFDPVMSCNERRGYNEHAPRDPALQPYIEQLKWAQAILFVYPTWWYGLPAMLKGWLDRVWALDVAFRLPKGKVHVTSLMPHITKLGVLTTCGAPGWWSMIIGEPGRKTIMRGIRSLCATRCRTLFMAHYKMDISTPATRTAFLKHVRKQLDGF
jgi:NAD(P)H dehydrogenase (quinone)